MHFVCFRRRQNFLEMDKEGTKVETKTFDPNVFIGGKTTMPNKNALFWQMCGKYLEQIKTIQSHKVHI